MNGIKIKGTGKGLPRRTMTNEDMAKIVETSDEWITTRTGIQHRHHVSQGESITALTVAAARQAMENAGVTAEQIGACVVATLTPDTLVPSAACWVQRELGLPHDIPCFDLNAACTGFLYALHTMECLLNASPRKFGLVIGAEQLSRITNWGDLHPLWRRGRRRGGRVPGGLALHRRGAGKPRHGSDAAGAGSGDRRAQSHLHGGHEGLQICH